MTYDDRPSKTQRKQAMHALQDLGAQLVELSTERLSDMPLDAALLKAILEAKRITAREARRRQLQYIGRLMRDVDAAPIRARLAAMQGQSNEDKALHRAAERWRDALIAGGDALTAFAAEYAGHDLQPLRNLVRVASADVSFGRPPRHHREIYRMVRAMIEHGPSTPAPVDVPAETVARQGQ